jgi:hypothetical protein
VLDAKTFKLSDIKKDARIYFIGIGGISMNGLARLAKHAGFVVGGSDNHPGERTEILEAQGIKQDGSYAVDVRHILIKVEGGTENADGTITFSDPAAAAAAKAEAEKILALWLQNPTEDYFGELAREHTADGNGAQGGIYTDVTQGRMVKTFDAWCFDPDRQVGDYGIVETKFGYHIMFFSKRGEDLWLTKTRQAYLGKMETELLENALESYEMEVKYSKIALAYVKMG